MSVRPGLGPDFKPSIGFNSVSVTIQSIDQTGIAYCVDRLGKQYAINTVFRSGTGCLPQEGESWIINKSMRYWTFVTRLSANLPTASDTPSVIAALQQTGLIASTPTGSAGGMSRSIAQAHGSSG